MKEKNLNSMWSKITDNKETTAERVGKLLAQLLGGEVYAMVDLQDVQVVYSEPPDDQRLGFKLADNHCYLLVEVGQATEHTQLGTGFHDVG